MIGDGNRV